MFIRSLEAKCAKFHTRDGPSKGRSRYKELHCQVPLPAAPWRGFQLLESVKAPGQKPRDNAFKGWETSGRNPLEGWCGQPEAGPPGDRSSDPPEAPCSQGFSGTHPLVNPGKESQLSVGRAWPGPTALGSLPSSSQLLCGVCCTATPRVLGSCFTPTTVRACHAHFRDRRGEVKGLALDEAHP